MQAKIFKTVSLAGLVVAIAGFASIASAASTVVSYGFSSSTGAPIVGSGAGVIGNGAGDQWMVEALPTIAGNTTALTDVDGNATGYTFSHLGFEPHNLGSFGADNPGAISPFQNSWFGRSNDRQQSYTFDGLNPGDIVDLVFFSNYHYPTGGASGFARGTDYTIGATTLGTSGVEETTIAYKLGINYVQFNGLVVDGTGQINVLVDAGAANTGFPDVNGFQLRVIPEPASLALLGLGGLLMVRRRRA